MLLTQVAGAYRNPQLGPPGGVGSQFGQPGHLSQWAAPASNSRRQAFNNRNKAYSSSITFGDSFGSLPSLNTYKPPYVDLQEHALRRQSLRQQRRPLSSLQDFRKDTTQEASSKDSNRQFPQEDNQQSNQNFNKANQDNTNGFNQQNQNIQNNINSNRQFGENTNQQQSSSPNGQSVGPEGKEAQHMAVKMASYNPSFYDPQAAKRDTDHSNNYGGVSDYGFNSQYSYGGGGSGSYSSPAYGTSYGGDSYQRNSYSGSDTYNGYTSDGYGNNYEANNARGIPRSNSLDGNSFLGGASVAAGGYRRMNAIMGSEERENLRREQSMNMQQELAWQVEEKKRLEAEKKAKEEMEDMLIEENFQRQQEKIRQEYEAEQEMKRRKEEEQKRRREAQIAHMEEMRRKAEEAKREQMEKARLAGAERVAAHKPPQQTPAPKPAARPPVERPSIATRKTTPPKKSLPGSNTANRRQEDFGLQLNSASTSQYRKYNKFFDQPSQPAVDPWDSRRGVREGRKRYKPPTPIASVTHTSNERLEVINTKKEYSEGISQTMGPDIQDSEVQTPKPSTPVSMEVQANILPQTNHVEIQTERPNTMEDSRTTQASSPEPKIEAPPFDWKINVTGMTEEEREKQEELSQQETRDFQNKNNDVRSQLSALRSRLRGSSEDNDDGLVNGPRRASVPMESHNRNQNNPYTDRHSADAPAYRNNINKDTDDIPEFTPPKPKEKKPSRKDPFFDLDETSGTTLKNFLNQVDNRDGF